MEPIVKIETVWVKEDATGNICNVCKEPIFSKSNIMYLVVNEKKIQQAELCESCFQLKEDV